MAVQKLNDELLQGSTQSDPEIFLYLLGNSLNNLTTTELTEQELELFTEVKFCVEIIIEQIRIQFVNQWGS